MSGDTWKPTTEVKPPQHCSQDISFGGMGDCVVTGAGKGERSIIPKRERSVRERSSSVLAKMGGG